MTITFKLILLSLPLYYKIIEKVVAATSDQTSCVAILLDSISMIYAALVLSVDRKQLK